MSNSKRSHPPIASNGGAQGAGEFVIGQTDRTQSPYRLVILIAMCVFFAEALVMFVLSFLPEFSTVFEALFDATLLTLLLAPVLYYLVYRPFVRHISELNRAEQALQEANKELENKVAKRTTDLQKQTHELNKRVKELNCLYGISDLFQRPGISLDEILKETVKLIPPTLQYPDITCARITINGQKYKTKNFKETEWKQTNNIIVQGEAIGSIDVFYLEKGSTMGEGPFLKEERDLIHAISERLVKIIELQQASEYLHQAHQQLAFKASELEAANAELSQYAHVAAHDLKAPLRAINNYASFLKEDLGSKLKGEQKDHIDALGRAAHEANELVQDLLLMSRVGLGITNIENVHTGTFLKELVDSLSLDADVKITMAEEWPTIEADSVLLRQTFQNLVENAVKFNNSAKICVELGWRTNKDGQYEFWVQDNGAGIEPQYHEQIFRVFERLHTRSDYEGTGIGLAIVKKAVSKLSGSVRIESMPGKGSTFFVSLPKTQQANQ